MAAEGAVGLPSEMMPASPTLTQPSQQVRVYEEDGGELVVENEQGDVRALEPNEMVPTTVKSRNT